MLVIGFSRGGTHLLWCALAAHSELYNRKQEVNQLASVHSLGYFKKIALELDALLGLRVRASSLNDKKMVDKAVCSWSRNFLFRTLKRNDPTKYIKPFGFHQDQIVFLIKNPNDQIASWMARGCTRTEAERAYLQHIDNWKKIANWHDDVTFIKFDEFMKNPQPYLSDIWFRYGLDPKSNRPMVTWAPKAHSRNSDLPASHSKARKWIDTPYDQYLSMLKSSSKVSGKYYANNIQSAYDNLPTIEQ